MRKLFLVSTCLLVISLPACTITRTANPISIKELNSNEICIIENEKVKEVFLPIYKTALEKKGFTVKVLSPESNPASCPLTTTYVGRWSWDFKLYMAYAEIVVYRNGTRAGDALYKAPSGGWSMTTEIYEATEQKIGKMVDQLFPNP